MKVKKDIEITLDNKMGDIDILRELVVLGLQRLEDVNKESWGENFDIYKNWGDKFLIETKL